MGTTTVVQRRRSVRRLAVSMAAVATLVGAAACDSAGPEEDITTQDLQALEEELGALEDRVGALEGAVADPADPADAADFDPLVENAVPLLGEEVTVSAEVSELVAVTDAGIGFRIGDESGEPVAVIADEAPVGLEVDDTVQVSGTVLLIDEATFADDFGIAAEELLQDPDAFFEVEQGEPALRADEVQILVADEDG